MDIYDTTIMGNERTIEFEIKFILDICGLDWDEYLKNPKILCISMIITILNMKFPNSEYP